MGIRIVMFNIYKFIFSQPWFTELGLLEWHDFKVDDALCLTDIIMLIIEQCIKGCATKLPE